MGEDFGVARDWLARDRSCYRDRAELIAGSIALLGFGADSLIESVAGIILLWRFAASRVSSESAERRAQKLIALSFYVIAAYVGFEALRTLLAGD